MTYVPEYTSLITIHHDLYIYYTMSDMSALIYSVYHLTP